MTSQQLVPALIIPFVAWRVYRRVRRNIGRQLLRPTKLKVSVGIFSTIILVFAFIGFTHPTVLAAMAGGVALSVPVALYGLKLTKFEDTPQGKFYTPNTALGIGISALFLGRIAYRFLVLFAAPDLQTTHAPQPFQSPLTFLLFGLSAGYFITYQIGVLMRSRHPAAPSG